MGKKHLEEVRKWTREHPIPPEGTDEIDLAIYRSKAPSAETVRAAIGEFIGEVASTPDPATRPCMVCTHPFQDHRPGSACSCCSKGVRLIPKGTDLAELFLGRRP